jgi:hypothetical protein
MKAITTKYHGPSNVRGSRVSADDEMDRTTQEVSGYKDAADLVAGDRIKHEGRWCTVGGFGKREGKTQMILSDGGVYCVIAFAHPERKRFEVEASRLCGRRTG